MLYTTRHTIRANMRFGAMIHPKKSFKATQCFKITEKVSFNIASEASYVYILSVQKFIKKAKNGFGEFLNKLCYQTGQVDKNWWF